MKIRILKIYGHAKYKRLNIGKKNLISFEPKIILQGNWLKVAGFNHTEQIKIEVLKNKLIIEKL